MCATSMIGDYYADKWRDQYWHPFHPTPATPLPGVTYPYPNPTVVVSPIGREEFDALKRDVEEMKALLIRAKNYDEANNEPSCEIDEKMDLLRKVAKLVGVDLSDVIGKPATA